MDPSNQQVLRSPRKMAKSALLLAALAAPSGALVAPGPRATRGSALAHHKQRSAVEDLKIYRRMKSWETNEEIVDEAAIDEYERSLRSYKPKVVTYGETRKEGNGLDLPLCNTIVVQDAHCRCRCRRSSRPSASRPSRRRSRSPGAWARAPSSGRRASSARRSSP